MSLPSISNLTATVKSDASILLTALFSDGQIMLGHQRNSVWRWESVEVPTPLDSAPASLTYLTTLATFHVGTSIADILPTVVSGVFPASFSISPALPAGLALDTATGIISGTPTTPDAAADYTITATNTYGSTTAVMNLTVVDQAPAALSYMASPLVSTKNSAITSVTPQSYGGPIVSYAISPALPAGLTLNTTTGVLSGTPSALSPATVYTVTATNTGGTAQCTFTLTVKDVAPSALTYGTNPATFSIASGAITPDTPANSGGTVVTYAIAPALPAGLTMSTTTGIISGTPSATNAGTDYTITATNTGGSTTATVHITVTA